MDLRHVLLQTLTQKSHLMFSNATCISPPPLLLSFLENNWTPVSSAQDTLLVPRRILSPRSLTLALSPDHPHRGLNLSILSERRLRFLPRLSCRPALPRDGNELPLRAATARGPASGRVVRPGTTSSVPPRTSSFPHDSAELEPHVRQLPVHVHGHVHGEGGGEACWQWTSSANVRRLQ